MFSSLTLSPVFLEIINDAHLNNTRRHKINKIIVRILFVHLWVVPLRDGKRKLYLCFFAHQQCLSMKR